MIILINFPELVIIHRRKKYDPERIRTARGIVITIEIGTEIEIELSSVEKIAVLRDPQIVIHEEDRKILTDKNDRTRLEFSIARETPNDRDLPQDRRIYQSSLKYQEDPTRTIEQPRKPPRQLNQQLPQQLPRQLRRLAYQNSLFVNLKKTLKTR